MALNSMNKILWRYTDDLGTNYACSATKALTDQLDGANVKVGGVAGSMSDVPWPKSWRKRKVYMTHAGLTKAVVAYTTTALIWATPGTTLNLNEGADVQIYTASAAHLGERKRKPTSSTT